MSTESSQSQQSAPSSTPFSSLSSVMASQLERVEAFYAQLAEFEAKAIEQQKKAIEESARLSLEGIAFGATLAAEWRKASLEATRRAMQMMTSTSGVLPKMPFGPFSN